MNKALAELNALCLINAQDVIGRLYSDSDVEIEKRYGTEEDGLNVAMKYIELAKEPQECEWIHYNYRTIAPKHHDINNPYWRIPENMDKLKYCPYCGRKIKVIE